MTLSQARATEIRLDKQNPCASLRGRGRQVPGDRRLALTRDGGSDDYGTVVAIHVEVAKVRTQHAERLCVFRGKTFRILCLG